MARPCVLFLDEFDAVAKLRDDKHELGELKRVVVSLLQNIDALDGRTILLAATNHEHLLDPAIWRRFAYRVRVARPTLEARTRLYEKFIGEFGSNKDIALFAAASQGLTGAEIRQIAEDSKRSAIIAGRQQVDEGDVVRRIVKSRAPEHFGNGVDLAESVRGLRALDEKLFTYRRLAEVFDVSVGHISNLIKKGD
jgi:ATP-dependent 26S proteasome regulatory subunit